METGEEQLKIKLLSNWYALQVRTRHEEEMIDIIRRLVDAELGEEVFTMLKKKEMHGGGGARWIVDAPMFPGYLFLQTNDINRIRQSLRVIVQFKRILKAGGQFMPLYEQEVELLKALGGADHVVEMSIGWKEGDQVGVLEGPLVLFRGEIKKVNKNKNKALIETTLFGQPHRVWVGLKFLASKTEAENIVWKMRRKDLLPEELYPENVIQPH